MTRVAALFLFWTALTTWAVPAYSQESGDVLLAIEAARHAKTETHRAQAALSLETLAHEDAPGAASALASLIVDETIDGTLESARQWAERGHELGEPDATYLLARMWAEGMGGERDLGRAASLARTASKGGLPAASVMIYRLLGDSQPGAAMAHLSTAAELGHPKAQHLLGMHLAAGEDVQQDYEEAFFWLVLAEAHGQDEAGPVANEVARHLEPGLRQDLIRAAIEWTPR